MLAHAAGQHVADRKQRRAAMVIDHALGIARGARGVVERDRVPFVARQAPRKVGVAGGDEILVLCRPQPLAGAGEFGIVVIDHQRFRLGERERLLHQLGEFAVDDQHLGFGMIELECDDGGVEPGVDGVEHGAGHGHAVVAFEHGGRIGEHGGDGVAALDAAAGERAREAAGAGVEFGVAAMQPAMDDGGAIGEDRGAPLQERQRGERLEVCRIAIEIDVVGRHVHHQPAAASLRMVSVAINPAAATIARRRRAVAIGRGRRRLQPGRAAMPCQISPSEMRNISI